jgi:hypothetical protein
MKQGTGTGAQGSPIVPASCQRTRGAGFRQKAGRRKAPPECGAGDETSGSTLEAICRAHYRPLRLLLGASQSQAASTG